MHRRTVPLLALLAPFAAEAAAPALVPVTGFLTDDAGAPINDQVSLEVKLYRSATTSEVEWEEVQLTDVDNGQFTVYLGDQTALDLATFLNDSELYIGIGVDGGAEMSPRMQIATAPYAAYAQYCDDATTLGGVGADEFRLASDDVLWTDVDGIPADLADGDADTTYTAGTGLALSTAKVFSADQSAIEGWAKGVAYDTLPELRAQLDAIYTAKQACSAQQVLVADGNGAWACTDASSLPISEAAVDAAVSNNGYAAATALTSLTARVTAAEGAITTLTSGLAANGAVDATQTANITTLTSGLAANGAVDATQTTNITAIQGQVAAIGGNAGNLSAQYEFNETSGTTLADSSPSAATATVNAGGVLIGAGGHAGNAVSFADKGILVAANNKIPDSAQIWVEAWVQPQLPLSQNRVIVDKTGAYKLRQNSGGIIEFTVTAVNGACAAQHPTAVTAGAWAHVAGYYDGQAITVEVGGVPYSTVCTKGPVAPTAGGVMAIGGTWNGSAYTEGFKGEVDEVRIRPTSPRSGPSITRRGSITWNNNTTNSTRSWVTLNGSSFTATTTGGPLMIYMNIWMYGGSHSTCQPIIDGVWAGSYGGLPNYGDPFWKEGLIYGGGFSGQWFPWTTAKIYSGVPAGTHTFATQCVSDGGTVGMCTGSVGCSMGFHELQ